MGQTPPRAGIGVGFASLPWLFIALCLICIYLGILGVRMFTAMERGAVLAGGLGPFAAIVSTAPSLVLCLAATAVLGPRRFSPAVGFNMFAVVAVVYIGVLLLVTVSEDATVGKRLLVGSEHALELLLVAFLAFDRGRRPQGAASVFGVLGIVVWVVPRFVSLDLMYRTGLLETLSTMPLVTPIAAAASFAIAAASVFLLVSYSPRALRVVSDSFEDRQADLYRRAFAGSGVTDREFDVALLTYRGLSAKKAAQSLLVSESTVKVHLSHVYRKLGIHSKQELIEFIDGFRSEP